MLTSSVTVLFMMAFTWWGLLGFLAIVLTVSYVFAEIEDSLGRKKYYIALFLTGMLLMKMGSRERRQERETVRKFIASWSAESKDFPDGVANTDSMWYVVDFERSQPGDVPNDPYFVRQYRLESHSPVRQVGSEMMPLEADIYKGVKARVVKAKVFESDVTLSGQAVKGTSGIGHARAQFWVAMDNNEIVKFIFDDF